MATMQNSVGECKTDGERLCYEWLKAVLPDDALVWSNIQFSVSRRDRDIAFDAELDFAVFHAGLGLLLLEVKDWRIDQVAGIDRRFFRFNNGRLHGNPQRSLTEKRYALEARFRREDVLCTPRGLAFCVNIQVALPFIGASDWRRHLSEIGLDADDVGLSSSRLLLQDDMSSWRFKTPTAAVEFFRRRLSVFFDTTVSADGIEKLRSILGSKIPSGMPVLAHLKDADFRDSLLAMRNRGGECSRIANTVEEVLREPARGVETLGQMSRTEDPRLTDCVVYTLKKGFGLATIHHEGIIYPMFLGTNEAVERWIVENRSLALVVDKTTHKLMLTRVSATLADANRPTGIVITEDDVPLFRRALGVDLSTLGLSRLESKFFAEITEKSDQDEIAATLEELKDNRVAVLLGDMISLSREGKYAEAKARYALFIKAAEFAELDPVLEAYSIDDGVNTNVVRKYSAMSKEEFRNLMSAERFQEWILFLHPDQKSIADMDVDKPLVVTGTSGSGKTCILVHRARRLAQLYPEERIGILTLSRTLARLIKNLVSDLCSPEERERIDVLAYYDYFRLLIQEIGADDYFRAYARTLDPSHGMARDMRMINGRACVNDYDPRSMERLEDTWDEFLEQREGSIREASTRLFTHLRTHEPMIDAEAYLRDEFLLIRTGTSIEARKRQYITDDDFSREGRSIPLLKSQNVPNRQDVLYLLRRYEWYMFSGGMMDEAGLTQILLTPTIRDRIRDLPDRLRFKCLLVDEFQDFSSSEIVVLKTIPTAAINALSLFGDLSQKILVKGLRMAACGLLAGSATCVRIRKNYRNSRQILLAASKLVERYGEEARKQGVDIETIDPELAVRETARPLAMKTGHEIAKAWALAKAWISGRAVKPWAVCIASASRQIPVSKILDARPADLLADRISGDYEKKVEHVVVGTISDVKGFEFSLVIIVGCSDNMLPNRNIPAGEAWRDALRLYVAMTRGRDEVNLLYEGEPSQFLVAMKTFLTWQDV